MRHARVKPEAVDSFMHVYNRVAGCAGEYPFGAVEKEELFRRVQRLTTLYVVEVLGVQCMGNHFHLLVHIPGVPPTPEEAAERYEAFHGKRKALNPEGAKARALALQLRDISLFMRDLQQPFTRWYNRTRPVRRRGPLWAERFKNTVLEDGLAVWDCLKYLEMNPVRAGLVRTPADYRFCTFGRWTAAGRHPFGEAAERRLLPTLRGLLEVESLGEVHTALREEFARIAATAGGPRPEPVRAAVAAEKEPFQTRLDRRVRYWVDGLVIGSERFVRETMARTRPRAMVKDRRLVRACDERAMPQPLFCYRQLRVRLE